MTRVHFDRRRAAVEPIATSQFRATCLSVLERVRKTRKPVLVTRFGVPVVKVVPPSARKRPVGWLGALKGTGQIVGDIVAPATEEKDWEVLRP
jgi:prevent-host-death family protein